MLLKYNPKVEHLKCVMLTPKEGLKLTRNMVHLLPGTNEVTDDEWKAMRGNIVTEIKNGEIVTLAQKVKTKTGDIQAKNLKDMPANVAIKFVSECNNADTLKKWYNEVINEEVRLAITKKFKKLEIEIPEDEIPSDSDESTVPFDELDDDDEQEDSDDDFEEEDDIDFSKMNVNELKEECEKRGIETDGKKKSELIDALNGSEEE